MIKSHNEWDQLREVVVGRADYANYSTEDPVYNASPVPDESKPQGPVDQRIIDEANEDLENLVSILKQAGVIVHRPEVMDFQKIDGMSVYCPRDRLLIAGETVVDVAMQYPSRDIEILCYNHLYHSSEVISQPRLDNAILDAANICRLNDRWIMLESPSGNKAGHRWIQEQFPDIKIELVNLYVGVHIDSTIIPIREGLVLLNGSRVNENNMPESLKGWDKIYVHEVNPTPYTNHPMASNWIALNMLSISPDTVIMDQHQPELIKRIESYGITVVPSELRHSRSLGGGFHCVTLDLHRE